MTALDRIDYVTFCDLHALNEEVRFVINKKYGNQYLTVDEWYVLISPDFVIGEKINLNQTN